MKAELESQKAQRDLLGRENKIRFSVARLLIFVKIKKWKKGVWLLSNRMEL